MPEARLSVVIAAAELSGLGRCLASLAAQREAEAAEVVIAASGWDEAAERLRAEHPELRFVCLPARSTVPDLLGAGLAQATGEIIAITDSACVADAGWLAAVREAHRDAAPVIGGAVEIAGARSAVDWAAYFCEYAQFMRPLAEGPAGELPGNNLSLKRWALERGEPYARPAFWKTYWCRRLQAEGFELRASPAIVVYAAKAYRVGPFLARRFRHGRCFAGMRVARSGAAARALYACGSVALPVIFLGRILRVVAQKRRYAKEFALAFPLVVLAVAAWSAGELCGYVAGAGESCGEIY
jgi:hypothetical protein